MHRLIERFPLQRGAHESRGDGMCAMEMVAWLAGEPHSDEPLCACPVLAAFVRACNDVMTDAARNRHLRPLVPLLVNTRAGSGAERARGFLVLDSLLRRLVPAWLRRRRCVDEAVLLETLAPITDAASLRPARCALPRHHGNELHATEWVVQRATEGLPPARYVAGAAQVARALGDEWTWRAVASTIATMARLEIRRRPEDSARPDVALG